jgi:hypothetical protein
MLQNPIGNKRRRNMNKSHVAQLDRLDRPAGVKGKGSPPVFAHWLGNPWTEEEKVEAMRNHSAQRMFWKPLSDTVPL